VLCWLLIATSVCFSLAQEEAQTAQGAPVVLAPTPANADPAFEVATIKPSDTSAPHGTFLKTDGRHSIAYNFAVRDLICFVYGVHKSQIVGGSKALLETHFDIDGVPDIDGHPNIGQERSCTENCWSRGSSWRFIERSRSCQLMQLSWRRAARS